MDCVFNILISLFTLTVLEIVLGVDNIVFLALLSGQLPAHQQQRARKLGLSIALITRVLLLCGISWLTGMTRPLLGPWTWMGQTLEFSARDCVLLAGGVFLVWKATSEIYLHTEGDSEQHNFKARSFTATLCQIVLLDIIFSLDSVITAVGMARQLWVMILAVIIAVGIMLWSGKSISEFIEKHASIKMLALSFLLLVGVVLVADGLGHPMNKSYIYFAMSFSIVVELLNIRRRKKQRATLTKV